MSDGAGTNGVEQLTGKAALIEVQKGKTPEQFYYLHDGGQTLTRFQTQYELEDLRAINRNFFVGEVLRVVEECIVSETEPLDELNKKFRDPDSALSILYAKGISQVRILAQHIAPIVDFGRELFAKNDERLDHELRVKLRDYANEHVIGQKLLHPARALINAEELHRYEQQYAKFTQGFQSQDEEGNITWEYGWNEAQKLIKDEIKALKEDLSQRRDLIKYCDDIAVHYSKIKNLNEKERGIVKNNKNTLNAEYDAYDVKSKELADWTRLYAATEKFRNNDTPFEEDLWQPFKDKYGTKELKIPKPLDPDKVEDPKKSLKKVEFDTKVVTAYTPPQVLVNSPVIAMANRLGKSFGVSFISAGIKTFDSLLRKISNKRFGGKTDKVFDSVRLSISVQSTTGIGFLLSNIKDIAKKNKNPVEVSTELYESYLFSWKINRAVHIDVNNNPENTKIEQRVGETKIVPEKLLEVKKFNDIIYDLRRRMKPRTETSDRARELLDPESRLNKAEVEYIHSDLMEFLEHDDVKGLVDAKKFFGFDVTNEKNFKNKQNFERVYDKLTELERVINIDAIKKSDKTIKCEIYIKVLDEIMHPQNPEEPTFTVNDLRNIAIAFTKDDFMHFRKDKRVQELEAKAEEVQPSLLILSADWVLKTRERGDIVRG